MYVEPASSKITSTETYNGLNHSETSIWCFWNISNLKWDVQCMWNLWLEKSNLELRMTLWKTTKRCITVCYDFSWNKTCDILSNRKCEKYNFCSFVRHFKPPQTIDLVLQVSFPLETRNAIYVSRCCLLAKWCTATRCKDTKPVCVSQSKK